MFLGESAGGADAGFAVSAAADPAGVAGAPVVAVPAAVGAAGGFAVLAAAADPVGAGGAPLAVGEGSPIGGARSFA